MSIFWGTRYLRASVVAVCALLVHADVAHARGNAYSSSADPIERCWDVWGTVADAFGRPLGGATVRTDTGCSGAATSATDAAGRYTLRVKGTVAYADAVVVATKSGYETATETATITAVTEEVIGGLFVLRYQPGGAVSAGVQPGGTVAIEAVNPAPPPGDGSTVGAKVLADLPDGNTSSLGVDGQTLDGFTRWSSTSLAAVAEGSYSVTMCVVDRAYVGSCGTALGSESSMLLSPLETHTYVVDGTGPLLSDPSPAPDRNTLRLRPVIAVAVVDAGSGLDEGSMSLELDGVPSPATFDLGSKRLTFTPPNGLTVGIHGVTVSVVDIAGNEAELHWRFNVISVTAAPASASISELRVSYPPLAERVTFTSVPVAVSASTLLLSSSMSVGVGSAAISLPTERAELRFLPAGQAGISSDPIRPIARRIVHEDIAVLSPTEDDLKFDISPSAYDIGSVTVEIPFAYRAAGGEVMLSLEPTPTVVALPLDDPLPVNLGSTCAGGDCTIEGTLDCLLDSRPGVTSCEGTRGAVFLRAGAGKPAAVGHDDLVEAQNLSRTFTKSTPCTTYDPYSCTAYAPTGGQQAYTYFHVKGLLSISGHHRLYKATGFPVHRMASFQLSDVDQSAAACVAGGRPGATTALRKITQSVEVVRGFAFARMSGPPGPDGEGRTAAPDGGHFTVALDGGTSGGDYLLSQEADVRHVVSGQFLDGVYHSAPDQVLKPSGGATAIGNGSSLTWSPTPNGEDRYIELMHGTEFTGSGTDDDDFGVVARLAFTVDYSTEGC